MEIEDRRWLRLDNYVGLIETPCGTRLEILPKHVDGADAAHASRVLLRKMICAALDLPSRDAGAAAVERFEIPLPEWLIGRFLCELERLVKAGIRFDYTRVESDEAFLRGQLDVARQMRQPHGRQHRFRVRHDCFLPDRPENRLLKLALARAASSAQSPENWRLAHELLQRLHEIPPSTNITEDFRAWGHDRLTGHYRPLRPWTELILSRQIPFALAGAWHGITMLFPMETLFERYVGAWLAKSVKAPAVLRCQAASRYLCVHEGAQMFRMEPDFLVEDSERRWVLDTKWKRLGADKSAKYGIAQTDMYQLFAYGHKYLSGQGDLYLIYPRTSDFREPLDAFDFHGGLRLHVVPFDLDAPRVERCHSWSVFLQE